MIDLQVRGIQELENRLNRLSAFGVKDEAQLKSINERVGKIYNGYLQANLRDADKDILVYTKTGKGTGKKPNHQGQVRQIIKRGTLRRSLKVFQRRYKQITYAGPKSKGLTKGRKTKVNRQDGWFASIVEQGAGFEGGGRNKGIFTRAQKATFSRMVNLRNRLLQKEFQRYMR